MKKRIALLTAVLTFAFAAVADATLAVNHGMFGVSLGNTMQQVRHNLGSPDEIDHHAGTTAWSYDSRGLFIDFRAGRVHDLSTGSPSQRTASGVGVGSSETAVMRLVPGVRCAPNSQGLQGIECVAASGNALTDFHVTSRRGLVQSVSVTLKP
jgi:hypothetical protein